MSLECPNCKLISPNEAQRCDCGYDFQKKTVEKPYYKQELPKMKGGVMTDQNQAQPAAPIERYVNDQSKQPSGGDKVSLCCLSVSTLIFAGGVLLWLLRNPRWGIPGIVCFIIMGIGWTGISVTWKDAFKSKKWLVCPHCNKSFEIREDVIGKVGCPECKKVSEAP